jgi:hypothetical protein
MLTVELPERYIGQLLYLEPVETSQWKQSDAPDSSVDFPQMQAVGGFHLRVRYFLTLDRSDAWRGLVATVEQESHLFDRCWVGCTVNYQGYPDFTDRLRKCWCRIGPDRPVEPSFYIPSGLPSLVGQGILAENKALTEQALEAKAIFG